MAYLVAQLSDTHVGGPSAGSGERLSMAIDTINAMTRQPDRVLLTGDLTHDGNAEQWNEFRHRLATLDAPWTAIAGNHDGALTDLAGHRTIDDGPIRFVLVDSGAGEFDIDDARWLDQELAGHRDDRIVVAIHHPPFETGIWWMDCAGLSGAGRFEEIVRRHPQVIQVLSGHVHHAIATRWGTCSLWVSPSTSVSIAVDLDPRHAPAETAEPPSFSLHAYTDRGVVSHVVPVGASAQRHLIEASDFLDELHRVQADRPTLFD
ncbi:metallophosphoesterase [Ilumatobacter sp.]|uniref:metallophosphoesterase n=1 Tax=Ilumatobacter sp. TaxID=1967498 RepID=UPI003C47F703